MTIRILSNNYGAQNYVADLKEDDKILASVSDEKLIRPEIKNSVIFI